MIRTTRSDCAVMRSLIITHTHTRIFANRLLIVDPMQKNTGEPNKKSISTCIPRFRVFAEFMKGKMPTGSLPWRWFSATLTVVSVRLCHCILLLYLVTVPVSCYRHSYYSEENSPRCYNKYLVSVREASPFTKLECSVQVSSSHCT